MRNDAGDLDICRLDHARRCTAGRIDDAVVVLPDIANLCIVFALFNTARRGALHLADL